MSVRSEATRAAAMALRGRLALSDNLEYANAAEAVVRELESAGLLIGQEPHVMQLRSGARTLVHPPECQGDGESRCEVGMLIGTSSSAEELEDGDWLVEQDEGNPFDLRFERLER